MQPSSGDNLILALTKGRILNETLPLLSAAGIEPSEPVDKSRKLLFDTNQPGLQIVLLRGSDVCTYVRHGAAHVGVVGKDMLLEYGSEGLYEPLDLGIARCRLMTAGFRDAPADRPRLRVATKFVNVARRHYAAAGQQAEIIPLYGAMELAPLMNLADEIVDIVDTGNTLKANGMAPLQHIADVSSRLVVNKAAMRTHHNTITRLVDALREALASETAEEK